MSNPIEVATLALYAADDASVVAASRPDAHGTHGCWKVMPGDGPVPCKECCEEIRDSVRQQRSAENALLKAIRDARPRS